MKLIYALLIVMFLFSGCRSTKKLTESSAKETKNTSFSEKRDVKEEGKIENDKTTYRKTTITETEYDSDEDPVIDQGIASNETDQPDQSERKTDSNKNPKVKSTKVTVIEEGTEDKSKIETSKTDNSKIQGETDNKIETENSNKEKKSVPIPWGWIFGILALVAIGVIYLKRSKVFPWIKSVLSPAGKNQKI